ncbi:transglycosylase domain-containing protein [Pseudokineococcus sp. 1T1Z-3]|uniref:transglycosylase domain-containing protein n=1 Tax=Pseudokineococcus sp. 1T1Z-3 TaxID=3132745 RepID=UPI0030B014E5
MHRDPSSPAPGSPGPGDAHDVHPSERPGDRGQAPSSAGRTSRATGAARRPVGAAGSVGTGLATLVGAGVVAGLLVAGLAVPVVATAGAGADAAVETFEDLPTQLDPSALPVRSTIRFADGRPMTGFYAENRVVVPLDAMAPVVRDAVIAIEDERFYEHGGADAQGIARAFVNNLRGDSTQGASTLTQQWIKNVLLQQAREADDQEAIEALTTPDEARKIREIRLAIAAEEEYSKDQILENYLNIALFGSNTYGVEAASQYYFSKPAAELELQDAALLAGMIQNPSLYEPTRNPEDAENRRDTVLRNMLQQGRIDQAQHDAAVAISVPDQLQVSPAPNGCAPARSAAYFCDYVVQSILQDPAFGEDRDARVRALYRDGIDVTTTMEQSRQAAANDAVLDTVPFDDASEVGASLVSVEPGTGKVRAMAQNRLYAMGPTDERGYSNLNYNVDAALGGGNGFQPGSNWKPFTLVAWLQDDRTLRTSVPGASFRETYQIPDFTSCVNLRGGDPDYPVTNSVPTGQSRMSVLEATYSSVNTVYLNMAEQLDLCDIRDVAASMGAHPASGGVLADQSRSAFPSAVLGSVEVAPLTMAAAYATLASGGTYCPPTGIESTVDRDGQPIEATVAPCTQPLGTADHTGSEIANTATWAMENVFTRGTARRVGGIGRPAAGKTGTTDGLVQTWFSGYTPQLATTTWVGQPDDPTISLSDVTINGVRSDVFGSTYAAPMWRDYMLEAMDGVPVVDFGPPDWSLVGRASSSSDDDSSSNGSSGSSSSGSSSSGSSSDDEDDD